MSPSESFVPRLVRYSRFAPFMSRLHYSLVGRVLQSHFAEPSAGAEQVNVAIVEAGQDAPAVQIDPAGSGSGQLQDFVAADGDHAIAPDGDGRRPRPSGIDGPDGAVVEDRVRDLGGATDSRQRNDTCQRENSSSHDSASALEPRNRLAARVRRG